MLMEDRVFEKRLNEFRLQNGIALNNAAQMR